MTHTGVTILEFKNNANGITAPRCLCHSDISHLYKRELELSYKKPHLTFRSITTNRQNSKNGALSVFYSNTQIFAHDRPGIIGIKPMAAVSFYQRTAVPRLHRFIGLLSFFKDPFGARPGGEVRPKRAVQIFFTSFLFIMRHGFCGIRWGIRPRIF